MAIRKPSRPTGAKRPKHQSSVGDPAQTAMSRGYAQKLRTDRPALSFESAVKRAAFWAREQQTVARDAALVMEQNIAAISQTNVRNATQIGSANISSATLQSANPTVPGEGISIPGLSEAGVAPPPPPAL